MERILMVVFEDDAKAYEGARALGQLDAEGSIALHDAAVISKSPDGTVSVKQDFDWGPVGTVTGTAAGGLIGLLGGPAGAAVGAAAGALAGAAVDVGEVGVGTEFVEEAGRALAPGRYGLVADVTEEWTTPVDSRMEQFGGVVFRRAKADMIEAQLEAELTAQKAELAALRAERAQAKAERKAKIEGKLDECSTQLRALRERIKARAEAQRREGEAKVAALKEKAAMAKGDAKAGHEARIAEVRAWYDERVKKLERLGAED